MSIKEVPGIMKSSLWWWWQTLIYYHFKYIRRALVRNSTIFHTETSIGHVTRFTSLVPSHVVKSLQLIWRLGTRIWNLRVPHLQMNCSDLAQRQDTMMVVPVMATRVTDMPYYILIDHSAFSEPCQPFRGRQGNVWLAVGCHSHRRRWRCWWRGADVQR